MHGETVCKYYCMGACGGRGGGGEEPRVGLAAAGAQSAVLGAQRLWGSIRCVRSGCGACWARSGELG